MIDTDDCATGKKSGMEWQEYQAPFMHFLAASTFLYTCEAWTLNAELEKRIRANNGHLVLRPYYQWGNTQAKSRYHDDLLTMVKKRKFIVGTVTDLSFALLASIVQLKTDKMETNHLKTIMNALPHTPRSEVRHLGSRICNACLCIG